MMMTGTPLSPCPPLSDAEWPADIADLRAGFAGALNVYRTMAHNPALLRAWAPLRQHVVKDSALGPERSEVVILRTAHRMSSIIRASQAGSRNGRSAGSPSRRRWATISSRSSAPQNAR